MTVNNSWTDVNCRLTEHYVLENDSAVVEVRVQVQNKGDDAYLTKVHVTLPPGTSYINVQQVQSVRITEIPAW